MFEGNITKLMKHSKSLHKKRNPAKRRKQIRHLITKLTQSENLHKEYMYVCLPGDLLSISHLCYRNFGLWEGQEKPFLTPTQFSAV